MRIQLGVDCDGCAPALCRDIQATHVSFRLALEREELSPRRLVLRQVDVACIGPVTTEVARRLGITTTIMPSESTVPEMVQAIVEHIDGRRRGGREA